MPASSAPTPGQTAPARKREPAGRLTPILIVGLIAVLAALGFRLSPLGRELPLKRASLAALQTWAERSPGDPLVHYYLATQQFNERQVPQALASFEKALTLDPKMARAHLGRATCLREMGQYEESYQAAKKALELQPRSFEARMIAGLDAFEKSPTNAVPEFDAAVKLAPNRAEAWYWLGMAKAEIKQLGDAVAPFKKAIQLDPKNAEYPRELGRVLLELGNLPEAKEILAGALGLAPQDPAINYYLGKTLLLAAVSEADFQAADERLRTALEFIRSAGTADPVRVAAVHLDRADIARRQGRVKEGLQMLTEARKLDPNNHFVVYKMGELERARGNLERSKELNREYHRLNTLDTQIFQLKERIKLDQKDPSLRLRMARLFLEAGEHERAANQYQMCLYLKPDQADAKQELAALLKQHPQAAAGLTPGAPGAPPGLAPRPGASAPAGSPGPMAPGAP